MNCIYVIIRFRHLKNSRGKEFVSVQKETDILILNTGGPPAKDF